MDPLTRREFLKYSALGGVVLASGGAESSLASVTSGHCGWGAYVDPRGGPTIDAIVGFEDLIGRRLDVTRHYIRWGRDLPNAQIRQSANGGRIPLISLHPVRLDGTWVRWASIAAGNHDTELETWAREIKRWNRRAYFVFNHEPENDFVAGDANEFRAAYDHVKHVFDAVGAIKMHWVCTLMRGTYQGASGGPEAWLPSGAQLLGVDGYNRGACNPNNGWESFETIFDSARDFARGARMPLIVQEWGSVGLWACGERSPQSRAEWIRDAGDTIKSWPEIEAVIYTNAAVSFRGQELSFRVDISKSALRAFRRVGMDPYFN